MDSPCLYLSLFLAVTILVIWLLALRVRTLRRRRDALLREKDVAYSFVHDVGDVFAESQVVDLNALLERVLFYAQRTTKAGAGALYLMDDEQQTLRVRAVSGMFPPVVKGLTEDIESASSKIRAVEKMVRSQAAVPGEGLIGRVASSGRSILVSDAEMDARVPRFSQEYLQIHSILVVPMRFHDEVQGVLAVLNRVDSEPFTETDQSLLQALADQASVSIYFTKQNVSLEEKHRIDHDLTIAKEIQEALLPREMPQVQGMQVSAFCVAAQGIGGDYYDLIPLDDTHVGIAIADVSGKGISGAIVMSMCRAVLRSKATGNLNPAAVLKEVNRVISSDLSDEIFISVLYMVLDTKSRELKIARAGHPRPIVLSSGHGKPLTIDSRGMALGLADPDTFDELLEVRTIVLHEGDTVVAYTDGVTEAKNGADNEWEIGSLESTLQCAVAEGKGVKYTADMVQQSLLEFVNNTPQYDDITFVAFRVT